MVKLTEQTCPVFRGTATALITIPECCAKLIKKEPLISSEKICGHLIGPEDPKGCRTGEKDDEYYYFECEKGHVIVRPGWYADVPIVPPGTIKGTPVKDHPEWYIKGEGVAATPHAWYGELTDEEKEKVWKK